MASVIRVGRLLSTPMRPPVSVLSLLWAATASRSKSASGYSSNANCSDVSVPNLHVRRCGGQPHRLIGHTPHRKRACTHDLTKRKTTIYPSPLMGEESKVRVRKTTPTTYRHIGFKAVSTGWMCRGRHTGFRAVSTGQQGDKGEQDNTNHIGNRLWSPM